MLLSWSSFQNNLNEYQYILNIFRVKRKDYIFNSNIELALFRLHNIFVKFGCISMENRYI